MKRLITFVCLILIIAVGYFLITRGFENDTFSIASYETLATKSDGITKKLANYDQKNQNEYETAISNLNSSKKTYKESKEKYEKIFKELSVMLDNNGSEETTEEIVEEIIYSDKEKYKVDFLLVILGVYGEEEGVDITYQLTTSSTIDPNSTTLNYFLSDLKFTVTGQYIDVAHFISDLEDDDRLNWEINNFAMNSGSGGVTATFTIKDVPIDSESFISSATAGQNNSNGNTDSSETIENTNSQNGQENTQNNSSTNTSGTAETGSAQN